MSDERDDDGNTGDFGGVDAATWARLREAARTVQPNAHVPYSDFHVGAALLTAEGDIVVGCNVENATLGATVCAERNAIGSAVSQAKARGLRALVVVTPAERPAAPCGICRQVLAEFCEDLPIEMVNNAGVREQVMLDELLPHRFGKSDFKD